MAAMSVGVSNARDRVNPELRAALDIPELVALRHPDVHERRAAVDRLFAAAAAVRPRNEAVTWEDRKVPGGAGGPDVGVRIYRPADQDGPLPGVCWIHGGGMTIGSVEVSESSVLSYVTEVRCVVVSVEYRLAPEHPHPAPVEDCYAALLWMAGNAESLGIDGDRLAVGGESSGGCLAAATALMARDAGEPGLTFQLLVYPMLDDRCSAPSLREGMNLGVWEADDNERAWQALLGERAGSDEVSHLAAPARAADLAGLPPAYLDVGELDVLRDEVVQYAARLNQHGVSTELHVYPGAYHGWDVLSPEATISERAVRERQRALRAALHGIS
jgi:acetyl esterase/lipase